MDRKTSLLETCAALIRDPVALGRDDPRRVQHDHGPVLLLISLVSAAIFGGVVGTYRAGLQLLYASLKLPLLWMVPVLVTLPAVRAFHRVCGIEVSYGQVALAVLVGCARSALLLAVASPRCGCCFPCTSTTTGPCWCSAVRSSRRGRLASSPWLASCRDPARPRSLPMLLRRWRWGS